MAVFCPDRNGVNLNMQYEEKGTVVVVAVMLDEANSTPGPESIVICNLLEWA